MEIFVSSETTVDIVHSEFTAIDRFQEILSICARDLELEKVQFLAIIYIIMNPEIAGPFPGGVIYRHSRMMLDVKAPVEFEYWKKSTLVERVNFLRKSALFMISETRKIPKNERTAIVDMLSEMEFDS